MHSSAEPQRKLVSFLLIFVFSAAQSELAGQLLLELTLQCLTVVLEARPEGTWGAGITRSRGSRAVEAVREGAWLQSEALDLADTKLPLPVLLARVRPLAAGTFAKLVCT